MAHWFIILKKIGEDFVTVKGLSGFLEYSAKPIIVIMEVDFLKGIINGCMHLILEFLFILLFISQKKTDKGDPSIWIFW